MAHTPPLWKMSIVKCFQKCVPNVCTLLMGDHEPRQKRIALIPKYVGVNAILWSMFRVKKSIKSCIFIKVGQPHIYRIVHGSCQSNKNISKSLFVINHCLQLHVVSLWICIKKLCNKSSFKFLNMDLCAINYTLNIRKTTPILEACHNPQEIFTTWPSNQSLEHNIYNNNKFMQDHVHIWFTNCKHFTALKVINSMNELVKRTQL